MKTYLIELNHISKSFKNFQVLKDINLKLEPQSFLAIMGRSGSGKSTLLNIIGLEKPDSGNYLYKNVHIEKYSKTELSQFRHDYIGYITQNIPIIPNLTMWENIIFPIYLEKKHKRNCLFEHAKLLINDLGISKLIDKKVSE